MSKILAYTYDDDACRQVIGKTGSANGKGKGGGTSSAGTGTGSVTISAAVGRGGANLSPDVASIQKALNRINPDFGGPTVPLVPDGICGPKTLEAIQKFQLHHFGWKGADGRVDRDGPTLARMNEILSHPQPTPPKIYPPDAPAVNDALDQTLRIHVNEVRQWVHEARYELMALEPFIDSLNDDSEPYKRINNIFAIGQSPNKRKTLKKILHVYEDMERAFIRHETSNNKVFELYRGKATGASQTGAIIAFTTAAGFFMNGVETDSFEFGPTRNDKVYLMPTGMVMWMNLDQVFYKSVLIHELAHFVGGFHSVGTIGDWDPEGTLLVRLRAANCYQYYARAVHFGTTGERN